MSSTLPDSIETLARDYKQRLLRESNLETLTALPRAQLRETLNTLVRQWLTDEKVIISRQDQEQLLSIIIDEAAGYGPLEPLLSDPEITEIMVNGPDEVWVERHGRLQIAPVRFRDEQHVRHILDRIVAPIGRRVDESCPMVDARLPDGSRVNGVIPPVSLHGPVMTIRKFRKTPWRLEDLVRFRSLSADMAQFLAAAIVAKQNIVISGGTGSGKTSLLTAVASAIPAGERVITIEDMAELRLERRNVVSLEARPANVEGKGDIPIRSLVRNALRMRPDRMIVGEVRGDEALDMLQAMNTGHEGSLTTVHANNPRDAIARLEAMVIMCNSALSVSVIRDHLVSALDLVVQTDRLSDGSRKVVSISEVRGVSDGHVAMAELFQFERAGLGPSDEVLGEFVATGVKPACLDKIRAFGIRLPDDLFGTGVNPCSGSDYASS